MIPLRRRDQRRARSAAAAPRTATWSGATSLRPISRSSRQSISLSSSGKAISPTRLPSLWPKRDRVPRRVPPFEQVEREMDESLPQPVEVAVDPLRRAGAHLDRDRGPRPRRAALSRSASARPATRKGSFFRVEAPVLHLAVVEQAVQQLQHRPARSSAPARPAGAGARRCRSARAAPAARARRSADCGARGSSSSGSATWHGSPARPARHCRRLISQAPAGGGSRAGSGRATAR